jgi:hypothetical protein
VNALFVVEQQEGVFFHLPHVPLDLSLSVLLSLSAIDWMTTYNIE